MIIRFLLAFLFVIQSALVAGAEESECGPSRLKGSDISFEQNKRHFEQQITVAEQLRQAAANAGAEWLETEGLLVRSRKEASGGNWSTALELVQKACRQAELALQQSKYESEAWKSRVIE
jgi:hypothetical protein